MRLWSMVVSHPTRPSVLLGRFMNRGARMRGAASGVVIAAISASLEGVQVGDQGRDLVFRQLGDDHEGARLGRLGAAQPRAQVVVVELEDVACKVAPGLQVREVRPDLALGRCPLDGVAGGAGAGAVEELVAG